MTSTIDNTHALAADDPLARDIVRLQDLKAMIASLEDEKRVLNERICKEIDLQGPVTFTTVEGEAQVATRVSGVTKEVNLVQLRDIDPDLFDRVTKTVLDARSLDRAIHSGLFSTPEHMSVLSVKEKAPYVRISTPSTGAPDDGGYGEVKA